MTYVVFEATDKANRQILVTADRNIVDKIITAWVEEREGEGSEAHRTGSATTRGDEGGVAQS